MILLLEQLRPLNDRIDAALRWLEDRKSQRISPTEREELSRIYRLLRDVRGMEKETVGSGNQVTNAEPADATNRSEAQ